MDDCNYDRDLHLEGVDVVQVVLGDRPDWIETERVHAVGLSWNCVAGNHAFRLKAGAKQIQADGEVVVVDEAAVGCEEAHESEHVPVGQEHADERIGDSLSPEDQVNTEAEEDKAMSNIPEHHSEQEGEGDDGEVGRICLLIPSHAVGLDDLLGGSVKVVALVVGGVFVSGGLYQLTSGQFQF